MLTASLDPRLMDSKVYEFNINWKPLMRSSMYMNEASGDRFPRVLQTEMPLDEVSSTIDREFVKPQELETDIPDKTWIVNQVTAP